MDKNVITAHSANLFFCAFFRIGDKIFKKNSFFDAWIEIK